MISKLYCVLAVSIFTLSSCTNGGLFGKKMDKSPTTGWNYNDKNQGGYQVSKNTIMKTAPGLVFVQGGTFTMGATAEDVMSDWNNMPRRITVNSFYIDKTEVRNVDYREYLYWLQSVFSDEMYAKVIQAALPDTAVWRSELAYNEPYVEYYFRHPAYNDYPVVGVTWKQASDFCIWRTDRVNEIELVKRGYINESTLRNINDLGEDNFTTQSYLLGEFTPPPGKGATSSKNPLKNSNGSPRTQVTFEDGILFPSYRLPTEAEWEYAALAYINQNPSPRKGEGKRGEELITDKQVYAWSNNYNGIRNNRSGRNQGSFQANFKRGAGDQMGVAGGLNDRAAIAAPVNAYLPNGFGIYNMSGNVSEWVADVYRPLTPSDGDDFNYFRGNTFKKIDMSSGKPERDSLGRIKMMDEKDVDLRNRRNYQKAYALDYKDGDSTSGIYYGYGQTTLISDKSRVVKGGGWNDRPYWLSPGTRRFLEEDQASSSIGFRCAMTHYGASEGGTKEGNSFSGRRQKR